MKKAVFSLLFAVISAGACAGIQAADTQMAVSLPQPFTILICAAGVGFLRLTFRKRS